METMEKQYVKKSIDFVWSEALKLIRKNPSLKEIQNDLISAGIEGLMVASKRFKPEKVEVQTGCTPERKKSNEKTDTCSKKKQKAKRVCQIVKTVFTYLLFKFA